MHRVHLSLKLHTNNYAVLILVFWVIMQSKVVSKQLMPSDNPEEFSSTGSYNLVCCSSFMCGIWTTQNNKTDMGKLLQIKSSFENYQKVSGHSDSRHSLCQLGWYRFRLAVASTHQDHLQIRNKTHPDYSRYHNILGSSICMSDTKIICLQSMLNFWNRRLLCKSSDAFLQRRFTLNTNLIQFVFSKHLAFWFS